VVSEPEFEVLDPEVEDGQNIEFDINDPTLNDVILEIDTEAVPVQLRPAPPKDGIHKVKAKLSTYRKDGDPVYIKGNRVDGRPADIKVVAWVDCRVVNRDTGEEGGFLKTWYPTSQVFKGQSGSQLTALHFLATGKPIKPSYGHSSPTPVDIKNAIDKLFAEAGDNGIELWVKSRWVWSMPKTIELVDSDGYPTGLYGYIYKEGTNVIDYDEVKGENKIKKIRALQGVPEDKAHLWWEPVAQEERSVQAEVLSLEDPSNFEEA
jgi:hypothetical protein